MKQRKFKDLIRFLPQKGSIEKIKQYCIDLSYLADRGYLNKTYCRTDIIQKMIVTLGRKIKSNIMLIGDPGVGKTAIVENLAYKIARREVPISLMNKKIISLDFAKLMSGARYRGDLEERLDIIISEVQKSTCFILFIDEIHNVLNVNNSQNSNLDIANILKPYLARGDFQCIGATTKEEYFNLIANKDIAFARRFQNIYVEEPSSDEVFHLLKTLQLDYEDYHFVKYSDEVLNLSINLCEKFILLKKMPDSVLDLLDDVGSFTVNLIKNKFPYPIPSLISEITILKDKLIQSLNQVDVDKAESYKIKILKKEEILNSQLLAMHIKRKNYVISTNDLLNVFIETTGFNFLKYRSQSKLLNLKSKIKTKLLFQEHVVETVCEYMKKILHLSSKNKGIGSFLFFGSHGVGKTYLVKILYSEFFSKDIKFIQIDCAKYVEGDVTDIAELIKSICFQTVGILHFYNIHPSNSFMINFINKYIFSPIDSIENKKIQSNILLKIFETSFDPGEIVSSFGFVNNDSYSQYFRICNDFQWKDKDLLFQKMLKFFKIDFLKNIDNVCIFNMLSVRTLENIFTKVLNKAIESLSIKYDVNIVFDKKVIEKLQENYVFYEKYGANFIEKTVNSVIIKPLETFIIETNTVNIHKFFKIIFENNAFCFKIVEIGNKKK